MEILSFALIYFTFIYIFIYKSRFFSRKERCKNVLTKHFTQDIDYKIILDHENSTENEILSRNIGGVSTDGSFAIPIGVAKTSRENRGGRNKETILLTVNTFKKLCLKSETKRADDIHNYFIKMEETMLETVEEESSELKMQLENKQSELENKEKEIEKTQKAFEKNKMEFFT